MPLIRLNVRNEYGLGDAGLYRAANKDDPKALLEGFTVSGLVGILRQLGDLTEFAAEVFDDLHEQVKATAARGHEMSIRVQRIEAELPVLEKAVMAQTSHIHFAYAEGSDWHPNIQTNYLVHNAAPRFIMKSYEECRQPPRLFLLDKFDSDGAGACLKRYSDPSFFKIACTRTKLVKPKSFQRENNAHKNKKKGRQQRGREVHSISIFQHHRRTQSASSDTDGLSSVETAEIISTYDARSKLEQADQPTSFGSTPSLNCDEPVLDKNTTIGPEEPVDKDLPTLKMKMQSNNMCASAVHDIWHGERAENDSLQGRSVPGSPSITWDEKTEISEYPCQQHEDIAEDWDQDIEPVPLSCSPYKLEQKSSSLINVDPTSEQFPGEKQFDEIAGETDTYMDAHNTMESECGTDSECQTKWEVQQNSNLMDQGIASVTRGENTFESSDYSNGYPISHYSAPNKEIFLEVSNSDTIKTSFHAQPHHIIATTSSVDSGFSKSSVHHDTLRAIGFEYVNSDPSLGSRIAKPNPQGNEVIVGLCIPEGSSEKSKVSSIKSWTNGRLFGVDPSKPLDVNVPDFVSEKPSSDITVNVSDKSVGKVPIEQIQEYSRCEKERGGSPHIVGPSSLHLLHPNRLVGKTGDIIHPIYHTEDSTLGHDKGDSNILMKQNSQTFVTVISETLTEKFKDSHLVGLVENSVVTPGAESSVSSNIEVSSCLSGAHCSCLVNEFQSNESLIPDNATKSSTTMSSDTIKSQERPNCLEQKRRLAKLVSKVSHAPTPNEQLELGPPEYQIPSKSAYANHPSPPLELMKISFHPIDCSETSKMKLKFPDGHQCQEGIQDVMFPAVQLLPDLALPLQDVASESDDDTFCRSSPYPSEDLCSIRSESNSEQWESGDLTGSKRCRIHNALHRTSSTSSFSSSIELEETHSKIRPSHEFGSLDAQDDTKSFDSDISKDIQDSTASEPSMSQREGKIGFGHTDFQGLALQHLDGLPPLPPLPPLQWRITKAAHPLIEDKQQAMCKDENQPNDWHAYASTMPLPPKPPTPKQPNAEGACPRKSKKEQKQQIGCRQLNQAANGKMQDESEDFLHQIKTKSLSLRRTVTRRPSFMPAPTTNLNVVAILEKANAIRQAFASSADDNEDESWSDD
ncbi:hypothetical protein AAC387_Pa06g0792 [Persea americana]